MEEEEKNVNKILMSTNCGPQWVNYDFASLYPTTMGPLFDEELERERTIKQRDENIDALVEGREPEPVTIPVSRRIQGHLVHDVEDITIDGSEVRATIVVDPDIIPTYNIGISSRKKEI